MTNLLLFLILFLLQISAFVILYRYTSEKIKRIEGKMKLSDFGEEVKKLLLDISELTENNLLRLEEKIKQITELLKKAEALRNRDK
jgi:hypothetical protein